MAGEDFTVRHLGLGAAQKAKVAAALGLEPGASVMAAALPAGLRSELPALRPAQSEFKVLQELRDLASFNQPAQSMIGLGYYGTVTPSVIQREILENAAWYTAYTPYQPEISQGRLEALFTFQTMVADLTGLPIANASLLDEATAAAEAMILAHRVGRGQRTRFAVDIDVFPQVRAVLATRAEPLGIELVDFDPAAEGDLAALPGGIGEAGGVAGGGGLAGAYVQYQGASGRLLRLETVAQAVHAAGGLLAVGADPLMLTLVKPPGELGADVCVGSTQRFGVPMGFGGPHAAYMSVRADLVRQLPGRLVGLSRDAAGHPALRLALVTREQHIRREKATSNICTAQVLLAVMAAMYAVWHGPEGLVQIATWVHAKAGALAGALRSQGVKVVPEEYFDTLAIEVPGRAREVRRRAQKLGVLVWQQNRDTIYVSVDQTTSAEDLEAVCHAVGTGPGPRGPLPKLSLGLPEALERTSQFLTHPVFHRYRTELAMTRYLKSLAGKDYAMDRGMIPLGSCTMKLNAAAEMAAITWPEFADLHPFAPPKYAKGTRKLIRQLEHALLALTGYDAISLQPNAGSQGELAGLLAIRGYHQARGDVDRTVCLIPVSAHGTNAASAAAAGFEVAGVAVDPAGNVSLEDLQAKLEQHAGRVGALMITYPSTHGVYEEQVQAVCQAAHEAGAQVYIDGANFNALVGWAKAGEFGGDVSHLNLHKTFAIPHGGGGPGVGPVACRSHLAPFLPGHPFGGLPGIGGPVSAAPHGSALVLPISWAYIRLMGAEGLAAATEGAVLAANYVAWRLRDVFPVLYRGPGGWVAHECLLDLRDFTHRTGVTVDDVAKRLMDYGFHAPTMSFPVAGTLMVEPTESESLEELDRFCDAMAAIAAEAERVVAGEWAVAESPLRGAPHTAEAVVADAWDRPYGRELAAFPGGVEPGGVKYWPAVGRVDASYGDRNLVARWPDA
ncbi:MAG: aminomethyl-transferring glycine dehydrogenase [Bifidobacteriaceae bacterium]|jgi:glycine dehydrogenase|nr:aminomethyl-transferring glycine dehydrogenase [Bifidobacteriaceae bacterium]